MSHLVLIIVFPVTMPNPQLVSWKNPMKNFLYSLEGAVRAWHEFLGFVAGNKVGNILDSREEANCRVALARLDAFIATISIFIRNDRTSKVGGHRQKLHQDKFSAFLPSVYYKLIKTITLNIREWCPAEL